MNPVDEDDLIAGGNSQCDPFPHLIRKRLKDGTGEGSNILVRQQGVRKIEDPVMKAIFSGGRVLLDESRYGKRRKGAVCFRLRQTDTRGDIAETGFERQAGKGAEDRQDVLSRFDHNGRWFQ